MKVPLLPNKVGKRRGPMVTTYYIGILSTLEKYLGAIVFIFTALWFWHPDPTLLTFWTNYTFTTTKKCSYSVRNYGLSVIIYFLGLTLGTVLDLRTIKSSWPFTARGLRCWVICGKKIFFIYFPTGNHTLSCNLSWLTLSDTWVVKVCFFFT